MAKDGGPNRNTHSPNGGSGRLLAWRNNKSAALEIFWGEVDATSIRLAVDGVTRAGGAIMFGRTSDGGALSIMVLTGDEKAKAYPHTALEAEQLLSDIAQEFV